MIVGGFKGVAKVLHRFCGATKAVLGGCYGVSKVLYRYREIVDH